MSNPDAQRLSELLTRSATRRDFITRASALSLAIPGVGAALVSCAPNGGKSDSTAATARPAAGGATAAGSQDKLLHHNSDSRLDSTLLKGKHGTAPRRRTRRPNMPRRRRFTVMIRRSRPSRRAIGSSSTSTPARRRSGSRTIPSSPAGPSTATSRARSSTAGSATRSSSRSRMNPTSRTRWTFTPRRSIRRRRSAP